jgi:DNA-binding transcriptional MerR regulator
MASKRKPARRAEFDLLLGGATLEIPMLTSREVLEMLDIKMSRLERFLENYEGLWAGQPGKGQGSRRLFSSDNVRRLFIAKWLLDDRFQPKVVAEIADELSDRRFIDYDKEGGELYPSLVMQRDPKSEARTFHIHWSRSGRAPAMEGAYYVLDLYPLIAEVDQRIQAALEKRRKL